MNWTVLHQETRFQFSTQIAVPVQVVTTDRSSMLVFAEEVICLGEFGKI